MLRGACRGVDRDLSRAKARNRNCRLPPGPGGHCCCEPGGQAKQSNLLIIVPNLGMAAQHGIDGFEHVVHALLGDRAFDHDYQFRLVG